MALEAIKATRPIQGDTEIEVATSRVCSTRANMKKSVKEKANARARSLIWKVVKQANKAT